MRCFLSNNIIPKWPASMLAGILLVMATIISGCNPKYYLNLKPGKGEVKCIEKFSPRFANDRYSALVDVTKHHFSGIMLFKQMPDSSTRVVFVNEMGVKFFEFSFMKDGNFIKHYALARLDKKIVIKTLRNDIRLVLVHPDLSRARVLKDDAFNYITVPNKKGNDHYVTDFGCETLLRIDKASKHKPVMEIRMLNYQNGVPDSILIQHKNFKFNIALKRLVNN